MAFWRQQSLKRQGVEGAEIHRLKEVQHSAYGSELQIVRDNKPLPRTSRLINFCSFMDYEGLLRVGGRMERGKLSYAENYPTRKIILREKTPSTST